MAGRPQNESTAFPESGIALHVESAIIDIDHWRHYFLILGALWGLMAASRPYLATAKYAEIVPA